MKRITPTTTVLLCWAVVLAGDALAQQKNKLTFKVDAANTKYTQQHIIDVDDIPGHRVRVFEVRRVYPNNPPVINGLKIVQSWARGVSDFINSNGPAVIYHIFEAENGDKFFAQSSAVVVQGSRANTYTGTTVGPITGGTGKFARIRGLVRLSVSAEPTMGVNETEAEIEYWSID
jgi:hypothetical protein